MVISTIERSSNFKKAYKKLPTEIKKKFHKQTSHLLEDFRYPSLRVKKVGGEEDIWEARIDISYRFTFMIVSDVLRLVMIGPHDEGLGKK